MHGTTTKITVILFISGRDSCPDERSNGLRAEQLHIYLFVFRRAYKIVSFIYLDSAMYFTSVSSTSFFDLLFYCIVWSEKCLITYRTNTVNSYSVYTISFASPRRKGTAKINYLQANTKPYKYAVSPSPGTQFVSITRPGS
jgi:hypothetical protein